ncbi:MAG: hypothetical protein CMB22_02460 [Euryarchaeota archaeon]|nr:hypothetical protein [Euryarchaeota archaeon]
MGGFGTAPEPRHEAHAVAYVWPPKAPKSFGAQCPGRFTRSGWGSGGGGDLSPQPSGLIQTGEFGVLPRALLGSERSGILYWLGAGWPEYAWELATRRL